MRIRFLIIYKLKVYNFVTVVFSANVTCSLRCFMQKQRRTFLEFQGQNFFMGNHMRKYLNFVCNLSQISRKEYKRLLTIFSFGGFYFIFLLVQKINIFRGSGLTSKTSCSHFRFVLNFTLCSNCCILI